MIGVFDCPAPSRKSSNSHSVTREAAVREARLWIGTPYRHQASVRGVGCDCLGLVRGVWRALRGEEPEPLEPYAPDWALGGGDRLIEAARRHFVETPLDEAEAGDVLMFRWRDGLPASHAGVLTAADHMVHAHDGAAVAEVALTPWWRRHRAAAFAFPG